MESPVATPLRDLVGRRVTLPSYFVDAVIIEGAKRVRREILRLGEDCPWSLCRLKEDLKDLHGRRLFPDRHVGTVSFNLGPEQYAIYKAATAYINEFLPAGHRETEEQRCARADGLSAALGQLHARDSRITAPPQDQADEPRQGTGGAARDRGGKSRMNGT